RERLIKISRDITIASKRVIFLLHRQENSISNSDRERILEDARAEQRKIAKLFERAAPDLQGNDFYKHHRSIGPGYEEYIEAASFLVYIERGELVTKQELEQNLVDDSGNQILPITDEDYLLGLADLTGELMRYCINIVGRGEHEKAAEVRNFLRTMKDDYEILNFPLVRRKMGVMRSSLQKVEDACYAIKVRGSEYPPEYFLEHDAWRHQEGDRGRGDGQENEIAEWGGGNAYGQGYEGGEW
ncbi:hypothetical protein HK104_010026, partial [Borealophlyctis nickersoniae]